MQDERDDERDEQESDVTSIVIQEENRSQYKRPDHFLTQALPHISRSFLKKLCEWGDVSYQSKSGLTHVLASLSKWPKDIEQLIIQVPPPIESYLKPKNIPIDILYEDEHLLFVNKPAGLVTHPGAGKEEESLVHALLYHCPDLRGIGGVKRPGIVHRLDKGTSGVMVVAKTQACHEALVIMFSQHDLKRVYEAICYGKKPVPMAGKMETMIGRDPKNRVKMAVVEQGKKAITFYKVLMSQGSFHDMEFTLMTGRTHQIRVHSSHLLKCPVAYDSLYGNSTRSLEPLQKILGDYPYPLLHAKHLSFIHPITHHSLSFSVASPDVFKKVRQLFDSL